MTYRNRNNAILNRNHTLLLTTHHIQIHCRVPQDCTSTAPMNLCTVATLRAIPQRTLYQTCTPNKEPRQIHPTRASGTQFSIATVPTLVIRCPCTHARPDTMLTGTIQCWSTRDSSVREMDVCFNCVCTTCTPHRNQTTKYILYK